MHNLHGINNEGASHTPASGMTKYGMTSVHPSISDMPLSHHKGINHFLKHPSPTEHLFAINHSDTPFPHLRVITFFLTSPISPGVIDHFDTICPLIICPESVSKWQVDLVLFHA